MRITLSITEEDVYLPAPWRIVSALVQHPPMTQAELRARTGLSHPVIVQQVAHLRRRGLVQAGEPLYGRPGRPCVPLTFDWQARRVLAIEVHRTGCTAQAMALDGSLLGAPIVAPLRHWTPAGMLDGLTALVEDALQADGAPWAGIGLVLPGGISADRTRLLSCAGMCGCLDDPLAEALYARFGLPVVLENEANALAQAVWTEQRDTSNHLLALSLRHTPRVGIGLLVDGAPVPGLAREAEGLGQVRARATGRVSTCGRNACVQTLLTAAGEDAAVRPQAVYAIGVIAAHLVSALTPQHLVLQGDDAWTEDDTTLLRSALHEHASPQAIGNLLVETRPNRPGDVLAGIANILITRLLDFRTGAIAAWIGQEEPVLA